jgi:hypothetical protein
VRIRGRCHCGNISFRLDWDPDPVEIPARSCDCTFCMKHGGTWTSYPAGKLEIAIEDPARVSRYEFGTKTATFHVCARCGIVPVVTSDLDGRTYAVVSVKAFENVDPSMLKPGPVSFDGEGVESRLARRKRNWIAEVKFR